MINLLGHIQVVIIVRTKEVLWMIWESADVMFILMLGICWCNVYADAGNMLM